MEDVDQLRLDARRLDMAAFVELYRGLYLVKRPVADTIGRSVGDMGRRGFATEKFSVDNLHALQDTAAHRAALMGEWVGRWMVLAVRKRIELYPDRISIGRTNASDIPIPLRFISKLHAHLYLNDNGTADVVDRSSNGMRLDRKPLPPGKRVRLYVGCRLELPPLELDLLNAALLYESLRG